MEALLLQAVTAHGRATVLVPLAVATMTALTILLVPTVSAAAALVVAAAVAAATPALGPVTVLVRLVAAMTTALMTSSAPTADAPTKGANKRKSVASGEPRWNSHILVYSFSVAKGEV